MELPAWITKRAQEQRFDVQRNECLAMGMSDYQLRKLSAAGLLISRGYGSYEIPHDIRESSADEQAELHVRKARTIAQGIKGAYLCGVSAVLAHGVPALWTPHRVELAKQPRLQSRRSDVRAVRGWGQPPEYLDGCPTQGLAEAIIEATARHGLVAGRVSADFALHTGLLTPAALDATYLQFPQRHGVGQLRPLLRTADGRIESPAESQLHVILIQAGLAVTPQASIFSRRGMWLARVDFLLDDTNVVLEYDGVGKYANLTAARDEKERDLRLSRAGYQVIHIVAADLKQPHLLLGRIREHLRQAERQMAA